jgi:hypothetical protein
MSEEVDLAVTQDDAVQQDDVIADKEPATAAEDQPVKKPWFEKRIGELTKEKYQTKQELENARAEAAELRAYLENQNGNIPDKNIPELVRQEAQKILAETSFNEKCNNIYAEGVKEFPKFEESLSNLQMIGIERNFLEAITLSDAGHKLINYLGTELDEAERLAKLPPLQLGRELTKLELKLEKEQRKVSKAPNPISTLSGNANRSKSPAEMTDAEYAIWRKSYK